MTPSLSRRRSGLSHDSRVLVLALLAGLPGVLMVLVLLWAGPFSPRLRWTLVPLVVGPWWVVAWAVRDSVMRPLQTVSNLLGALREEDFSFRARTARGRDDALTQVLVEVNALGDTLRDQRLGALEATALLRKVMDEIDVAIFAFDRERRLRLVNQAGARLLARPAERALESTASELGLAEALLGEAPRLIEAAFPGGTGRWELRRSIFRQGGRPHELLVLADVSRALREEERQAWQRLIRVLGHELNNSLAPIRSIAESLEALLSRQPPPLDRDEDTRRGLGVIRARAEALGRFTEAYSRLARLPPPRLQPVEVGALLGRVAGLENRAPVSVTAGAKVTVRADPDQLEQLLINLLRNAAEAARETGGNVDTGWSRAGGEVEIWVEDEGPGLPQSANLFVPFFTTKPEGSGIGLVLSRQIAEAHGGRLTLANRQGRAGCRATLRLPL